MQARAFPPDMLFAPPAGHAIRLFTDHLTVVCCNVLLGVGRHPSSGVVWFVFFLATAGPCIIVASLCCLHLVASLAGENKSAPEKDSCSQTAAARPLPVLLYC